MVEEVLLEVYLRAWNARDPDACAVCFTRDAVRELRIHHREGAVDAARGRRAIRDQLAGAMARVPDLRVEVLAAAYASDRRVWTEWRLTGTRAASGRPVAVVGVSVFRLTNDGFREERLYWDTAASR